MQTRKKETPNLNKKGSGTRTFEDLLTGPF